MKVQLSTLEKIGLFSCLAVPRIIEMIDFMGINVSIFGKLHLVYLFQLISSSMLVAFSIRVRKKYRSYYFITLVLIAGYLLVLMSNQVIFPENSIYIEEIYQCVVESLPLIFVLVSIHSCQKIVNYMYSSACVVIIWAMVLSLSPLYTTRDGAYMTVGYTVAPYWCLIALEAYEKKKIKDILLTIIGFLVIVLFGNRGALVAIVAFMLLYYWIIISKGRAVKKCAVTLMIGALILMKDALISALVWIADLVKIDSRTLILIQQGLYFQSKERMQNYEQIFKFLAEHPFGAGICHDRVIGGGAENYAHNIELELLLAFGWIGGGIIIAFIFWLVYRGISDKHGNLWSKKFMLFWAVPTLVCLQISKSLFTLSDMYIMIAVALINLFDRTERHVPRINMQKDATPQEIHKNKGAFQRQIVRAK